MAISERGYWTEHSEVDLHDCDILLCNAIINLFEKGFTWVDLGCGNGEYTRRLIDAGFDCKGFDGSPLTPEITKGLCSVLDLSVPVDIGTYDIVLCLEVGEHIPKQYEQIFLDNIYRCAKKYVILSWGVIGQGGIGHVNCQDNNYVIEEMKKRRFTFDKERSQFLRDYSTFPWFRNTIMFFSHD